MLGALIGFAGGSPLLPAPVLEDTLPVSDDTSASSHAISLASLAVGLGAAYAFVGGTGASSNFVSFSGDTDDTSSEILTRDTDPRASLRQLAIVSTFDDDWTVTWGGSTRAAVGAFVVSGASSIVTNTAAGVLSGGLPSHPVLALTGGPHNPLVIDMIVVEGAHQDVGSPPTAPSGEVLRLIARTGAADLPDDEFRSTLAIASMTLSGVTSIPAKTWGGLASLGRDWFAVRAVFVP